MTTKEGDFRLVPAIAAALDKGGMNEFVESGAEILANLAELSRHRDDDLIFGRGIKCPVAGFVVDESQAAFAG